MAATLTISRTSQMRPDTDGTHRLKAPVIVTGNLSALNYPLPAGGDVGKVLTVGAGPTVSWQTPAGGAGSFTPPVGIGTATPQRALEVFDGGGNPQVRLSYDGVNYTDLYSGPSGSLRIMPFSGKVGLNVATTPNAALQIVSLTPAASSVSGGAPPQADYAIYAVGAVGADNSISGAGTSGTGGPGGRVLISGGNGGNCPSATVGSTGGNGGAAQIFSGHGVAVGINGIATNTGGGGGGTTVQAGNGGNASGTTTGTNTGGLAGAVSITGGTGGTASNGATGNVGGGGGGITIVAGPGGGGATGGNGGDVQVGGGAAGAGTTGRRGYVILNQSGGFIGMGTNAPAVHLHQVETTTLTGAVTDGYTAGQRHAPTYTGAFTVTRHNYMDLVHPVLSGSAVLTDACVFRFDQAVGTHPALAAASTKATPGTVNGWLKLNVNGALMFAPLYTSMTS